MAKTNRNGKGRSERKQPARSKKALVVPEPGRVHGHKSIEELAREQGKELRPWTDADFERMIELGKGLFRSRKELEEFVAGIYERRRQSRGGWPPAR